jgi:lysyl-tRNA synthetase class 2
MDETAALIIAVLGKKNIVKKKYADIFKEATGIDPLSAGMEAVIDHCAAHGKTHPEFASLTDALQFAMAEFVEPALPAGDIVIIHHFPADQAVLATIEPGDSRVARLARVAKRFEAYVGGMELVNGFEELVDWKENERRQQEENAKRSACGKEQWPVDQAFIDALKKGLPPCSGAALGLDRLVMLALKKRSLEEVLPFTWEKS